jgi:hypothetical protein
LLFVLAVAAMRLDAWRTEGGKSGSAGTSPAELGRRPLLLPSAGYVVRPGGRLLTSSSGRAIVFFELPVRCGPRPLVIEHIPLSGRSFRITRARVGGGVAVDLSARIVDRQHIRGTVVAKGRTCTPRRAVHFSARLS